MTDRDYWCRTDDPRKLASALKDRIGRFRSAAESNGRRSLWSRAARMYYGLDPDGGYRRSHYIQMEGAQGEFLGSRANLYRAFVKSILVMITGSRPSFNVRPIAYDSATSEVVTIGNAYLDKMLDEGAEVTLVQSALKLLFLGEGWQLTTWDDSQGDVVSEAPLDEMNPEAGSRPICQGAVRVLSLRPDEVIRDPDVHGDPAKAHQWLCAQVQRNRWDLMAQYPQYAQEIHAATTTDDRWLFTGSGFVSPAETRVNDDTITTYELYHRKSLAMPDGLFALMVGDTIVSMGPIPYDKLPFDPMISDREPGVGFGYCPTWDLMAIQAVIDSVWMQMTTNRENLGRANVFLPAGTSVEPYAVGGTRLFVGAMPPQVVDLSTGGIESGEQALNMAQTFAQRISGLNDATLGQAGSSASGVALAQQQQTAVMFNSGEQLTYVQAMQGCMEKLLRIAQKFQPDEQLIHIAGKNRAPMVKRFKGEDFAALDGIVIELGSAAMRTSGSRHAIASELLQADSIGNPEVVRPFLEMIATGRLEPLLEDARASETQGERLMLEVMEGRAYPVVATMNHPNMIKRLKTILEDPSMEAGGVDPQTGQPMPGKGDVAMKLIQQHDTVWLQTSMSPEGMGLLMACEIPPHPAAQMMMQAQMTAPPPGAPQEGNPGDEQPTDNQDVQSPQNAPQPSPSGQSQGPGFEQPSLPEGAMPTA